MDGYQITFFTVQDHRHHGQSVGDWLVQTARKLGLRGATLFSAAEGFGHRRRLHSAHFVELADQPVEVVMVVSPEEAETLFALLRSEGIKVFYVKVAADFGTLGDGAD